ERLVENMSASQFDAVMKAKPEDLDDKAKSEIERKRKDSIVRSLGGEKLDIKKSSEAQLKVLGSADVVNHAADLKQSQFDDIMKSKDYTETEKQNIKGAREKGLRDRFKDPEQREALFRGQQDKDIASLPKDILIDEAAAKYLTGG